MAKGPVNKRQKKTEPNCGIWLGLDLFMQANE